MSETVSKVIRESQLFAHLSDEQMNIVVQGATLCELETAAPLIEEGTQVESLYIISTGKVEVFTNALGRRVSLTELGAGAYVGEVSLLSGKTATATVAALEPTTVVAIGRDAVMAIVEDDEKLKKTLEGVTLARAKDTLGKVLQ